MLEQLDKVYAAMRDLGFPMRLTHGVRLADEQHELWRQGRERPGRIVTNCDGYRKISKHQVQEDGFGHAVDSCFVVPTGQDPYKGPWAAFGACGEAVGLKWGGRFTSPVDRPHFELP